MARKKANYDVEEKIEPMKLDAMNPPENSEGFKIDSNFNSEISPCNLSSDNPTA